jgi:hypothetical protein
MGKVGESISVVYLRDKVTFGRASRNGLSFGFNPKEYIINIIILV